MNSILEGVRLSIAGISVTFAALGLLILAMIVLERAFRPQPQISDKEVEDMLERYTENDADGAHPTSSFGYSAGTPPEEVAAAIAVALAHLRSLETGQSGLGTALEAEHGSWWMIGQIQHLAGTRMGSIRPHFSGTSHLSGTTQQGRR